jgi:hypothetical protein
LPLLGGNLNLINRGSVSYALEIILQALIWLNLN